MAAMIKMLSPRDTRRGGDFLTPIRDDKASIGAKGMGNYYEFFAGGGMARAGLGDRWRCLFANDIDSKKAVAYRSNWGDAELVVRDVASISAAELPGTADLAWASFPCQDLSLAGAGAGLKGKRSGTFWPFWRLMQQLGREGRTPRLIVLENVCGALTSHKGRDFVAISHAIAAGGYRFGAVVLDAVHFVPQSRPRLFIICVRDEQPLGEFVQNEPSEPWHTPALVEAQSRLDRAMAERWVWWRLPVPLARNSWLANLIENEPHGVVWHTRAETARLLELMSPIHQAKVKKSKAEGRRIVGTVYKRTRRDEKGRKVQRAEVRFDGVAGCLRTPVGGSSRQTIVVVEGNRVWSRLLSPREAARLMGLPDTYVLPENYNEAYHLAGDGVVVPVVRFLAENIIEPLLVGQANIEKVA
jgi:DNA (cytosine-5)-methyltransferase 1